MKNLGQLMKQAQAMQDKMAALQVELEAAEITGAGGGGMVRVTLNGKGEMRRLEIDPALIDPAEPAMLADLIVAAHNDANTKIEAFKAEKMSELTGGLQLPPGMKLPF